jgi:DNA-directed RNA polymerase subunit E'/Rpb7
MSSPYINTKLYTNVSLLPNQMENKLYLNLKKNLERKVDKKCFRDKGFLMDVYKILEYKDGIIEAENPSGSAVFDVSFSCRVCIPRNRTQIICKINRVNKILLTAVNGPILVVVTKERINDKIFFTDNNNNFRYRSGESSKILKTGEFVKLTILSTIFNHGDDKIKAIGFINDIATEKEKENYFKELFNTDKDMVDFEKYMNGEIDSDMNGDMNNNAKYSNNKYNSNKNDIVDKKA